MEYIHANIVTASGPWKRGWLSCVTWLCLVVIAPATICAQQRSGSTGLRGSVSKTVVLSLSPNVSTAGVGLSAFENGGALNLVLSGSEFNRTIQLPILVRSNTAYTVIASVKSHTAVITQWQVLSVEAAGKLVAGDAVTGVTVERQFDKRRSSPLTGEENLSTFDATGPFTIFSGPRISLGGGLDSPHNAVKVVLLLSVQARVAEGRWEIDLELQGSETLMNQVLLVPLEPHVEPIQLCREYAILSVCGPQGISPISLMPVLSRPVDMAFSG